MIYSDSRSVVRRLLPKKRLLFPKIPGNFLFLRHLDVSAITRSFGFIYEKEDPVFSFTGYRLHLQPMYTCHENAIPISGSSRRAAL